MRRRYAAARALALVCAIALPVVAWHSAALAQNPPAGADRAAERARRQLQQQQQQMQELQQKAGQAQAEKEKAEQARAALQQQLKSRDAAAARVAASQRALAEELKAAQAAAQSTQAQQQARIAELEAALLEQRRAAEQALAVLAARERDLRQARATLQESGVQRESCQQRVAAQERTLAECGAKNDRLFKLGGELITRYRNKGVLDALRQNEPVLGLRDVEIFNEVQEYRDRADAARHLPGEPRAEPLLRRRRAAAALLAAAASLGGCAPLRQWMPALPVLADSPSTRADAAHADAESGDPGRAAAIGGTTAVRTDPARAASEALLAEATAEPTDPSYRIGPEDALEISVWKDETLKGTVLVRPDGAISFPLVGELPAAGRTATQVREEIAKRLARFMPEPEVTVAVLRVASVRIYVIGRVNKPGDITVGRPIDVLQALSLAGGLTPFANEDEIRIIRRVNGRQVSLPFDYARVRRHGELSQNILLRSGDVLLVP